LSGTLNSTLVFFVGLICGVTVGRVVLIAVIVIIICKMRLDLKLYLCMAIEFTNIKYKQINSDIYILTPITNTHIYIWFWTGVAKATIVI